jgi:long-chain acyl-CoA synthetase
MLYQALLQQAQRTPGRVAIVSERHSITYHQLFKEAQQTAGYLQSLSLRSGDFLVVGIPPSPEFFALFYAASALGVVVVPVSASGNLPPQVRSLGSVTASGDSQFLEILRDHSLHVQNYILREQVQEVSAAKRRRPFVRRKMTRGENVLGTSTSGSTGEPVIFMRSAEELHQRAMLRVAGLKITPRDVLLSAGPFTSGVNAVFHLVLPVLAGCRVIVLEKFDRRKAVESISRERVTVVCSVPLTFEVLAHLPASYSPDFSSLRLCISNGAPLARNIYERFHARFGIGIGQMYGGSDFAPAFTFNVGKVPDAVGQRSGAFPVNVVDDHGKDLLNGGIGEIVFDVSGVKNRALKKILERNSNRRGKYLYTGDLGRFDTEGNLFVAGRKNSLIKVGANRVMGAEVETVLRSHPRVRETLVFPLRAGQTDEAVGAVIVRDGRLTAQELIGYCAQRLDDYKCPRKILFRRSLPRNHHDKVIRYLFDRGA